MALHPIADTYDDDSASSTSTDDDLIDPSSLFGDDATSSNVIALEQSRRAFIDREEKHVRTVRRALAIAILICAIVVSSSVYVLARRSEHASFESEVRQRKIILYMRINIP